ncbi:MAG: hypothetical protein WBN62_19515, partial [Thermoanaerobaculia bacterium]
SALEPVAATSKTTPRHIKIGSFELMLTSVRSPGETPRPVPSPEGLWLSGAAASGHIRKPLWASRTDSTKGHEAQRIDPISR